LQQVKRYDEELLTQAQMVIDGKIYSYNRGETSLLEVLDAQRTYNELQTGYIETLYNCLASLVELERNAGIWDIK
jgi:cobalt-zinc-cadmium efflux system outer membrane protein